MIVPKVFADLPESAYYFPFVLRLMNRTMKNTIKPPTIAGTPNTTRLPSSFFPKIRWTSKKMNIAATTPYTFALLYLVFIHALFRYDITANVDYDAMYCKS